MLEAVIFDLDGVLVDSYRAHLESWQALAAADGLTLAEEALAATFGRTSREIIDLLWVGRDLDEGSVRALDDRKEALYRQIVARDFPVMDGARELIGSLRAAGVRLAVGSSGPPENVGLALAALDPRCFEAVINGRDVERGKPDPQVFLLAAERLAVAPASALVIEDAPVGIAAARAAGMAVVALASTGWRPEDLEAAGPDLVVGSLRELGPEVLRSLGPP